MPEHRFSCEARTYDRNPQRTFREGDYEFARTRFRRKDGHRLERGYDVASHFAEVIAARRRKEENDLERSFRACVERWKDETGHLSSVTKAISHPSYLRIIGLARGSTGHQIERLLLRELESDSDLWFAALSAITGEDPVGPEDDFDEAVNAWLEWGRKKGII